MGLLAAVFLGLVAALELGYRIGLRRSFEIRDADRAHAGALQAATLGLLALLLGFTFFMAVSRYDTRKQLVLDEANAIGTAALRARLLPEAERREAPGLFRDYVVARLAYHDAGIDPAKLRDAQERAARVESRLWSLAESAAARDSHALTASLFLQAMNDVIDLREKRQVAFDNHVPEVVLALLLAVSAVSLAFLGYGSGVDRVRRLWPNAVFAFLITLVFVVIVDLDRPRRGLIQVSQDSLLRLQASLDQATP